MKSMDSPSASPNLSSDNKKKVCVIVGINSEPSIFLVDLDFKYDVDANGFAEMKPNFRIVRKLGITKFCVVDATLYILHFDVNRLRPVVPELYSIELQAVSQMSDCRLELTMPRLTRCPHRFPKVVPDFVAYRGNLLIFSTEIPYEIEGDDVIDFELYDINSQTSTALPPLIVWRRRYDDENIFRLYNVDKNECYDEFYACRRRDWDDNHFSIVSSVVDEDRFIIETNFGKMFSLKLKLDGGSGCWRLCEEGYELTSRKNIVTRDGIYISDFMANDSRRRWLQQSRQYDQDHGDGDGDGDGGKRVRIGDGDVRRVSIPHVEIDMYGLQYGYGHHLHSIWKTSSWFSNEAGCFGNCYFFINESCSEINIPQATGVRVH